MNECFSLDLYSLFEASHLNPLNDQSKMFHNHPDLPGPTLTLELLVYLLAGLCMN